MARGRSASQSLGARVWPCNLQLGWSVGITLEREEIICKMIMNVPSHSDYFLTLSIKCARVSWLRAQFPRLRFPYQLQSWRCPVYSQVQSFPRKSHSLERTHWKFICSQLSFITENLYWLKYAKGKTQSLWGFQMSHFLCLQEIWLSCRECAKYTWSIANQEGSQC